MTSWSPLAFGLRGLHRDDGAALAPVFGFILVFFAWGLMTILNTGQVAYDKVRLQNTADAIALAHADQVARELNVMSMNNVALSQMIVISAVSFTLIATLAEFEARATAAQLQIAKSAAEKCKGDPITILVCGIVHAIPAVQIARLQLHALDVLRKYRPDKGLSTSQSLIAAFNRMNDHLARSFPRRAGVLMSELTRANGAETAFIFPRCETGGDSECRGEIGEGADLPVDRDAATGFVAYRELCQATETGSDGRNLLDYRVHGYPDGKGPYTAGGSGGNPHVRDHVNVTARTESILPSYGSTLEFWDFLINFTQPAEYPDDQERRDNDFITSMNQNWSVVCGGAGGILSALTGGLVALPKPYWLRGRPLAAALAPDIGTIGFDHTKLAFLAIVAQKRGDRINSEDLDEREDRYHAYAQALVYNPVAYDLYTSRWKSKLVPATWMDDPQPVADALRAERGGNAFDILARIIQSERDPREWARVNTH